MKIESEFIFTQISWIHLIDHTMISNYFLF